MKLGKLSNDELIDNVIGKLTVSRPEVILTAALGEDCAALRLEGDILISSDPITAQMPLDKLGALLVDVCCNDIAANGGEPVALTLTVILPPSYTAADVGIIVEGAVGRARAWRADIVGGHTEFSDCVNRPVVSGTALGRAKRLIKKTDMRAGDRLFVTKKLAMEGTVILAGLKNPALSADERAALDRFGKSLDVKKEGGLLAGFDEVHMLHDVTEGGILGAVAEVCRSAGLGARLLEDAFPFDPLTVRLCALYGLDRNRFLSSGSMLFAAAGGAPASALSASGVAVAEIGVVTEGAAVVLQRADGGEEAVTVLPDELYAI
ncbi:MAG: hypothetical protein LBH24_05380 [Clostridiales bacterium]|jgi:hydrogenase expression/formation protein HypE|nr:hypothetical protein [Clostridiales bacterium]